MTTPRTEDLADARTQSPPGESVAATGAVISPSPSKTVT